jgi:hypothetical protein
MSNPGIETTVPAGQAASSPAANCTNLFLTTLANLNAITEQQMKGLLDMAITTAKLAHSLSSVDSPATPDPAASGAFAELANQLQSAADNLGGDSCDSADPPNPMACQSTETQSSSEAFCVAVESNIIMAMQNSLAAQQQLNITGQAILTQSAALLLSLSGKASAE